MSLLQEKQQDIFQTMREENPEMDMNGDNRYENSTRDKNELTSGIYLVRVSERNMCKVSY